MQDGRGECAVFRGPPHVAFIDPDCPASAGPRITVEARGSAVFDEWKEN
jgi:hypothetical protein